MKKLFFTAIALVAFSGVSLAKTIEENKKEKKVKNEKKAVKLNCSNVWNVTYYYARQANFDNDHANAMAFAAYDKCLGCN